MFRANGNTQAPGPRTHSQNPDSRPFRRLSESEAGHPDRLVKDAEGQRRQAKEAPPRGGSDAKNNAGQMVALHPRKGGLAGTVPQRV